MHERTSTFAEADIPPFDRTVLHSVIRDIIKGVPPELQRIIEKRWENIELKDSIAELRHEDEKTRRIVGSMIGFIDGSAVTKHIPGGRTQIWANFKGFAREAKRMTERLTVYEATVPTERSMIKVVTVSILMHEQMHVLAYGEEVKKDGGIRRLRSGYKDHRESPQTLYDMLDEGVTERLAREATRAYLERTGDREALKTLEFLNKASESEEFPVFMARHAEVDLVSALIEGLARSWGLEDSDSLWRALVEGYLHNPATTIEALESAVAGEEVSDEVRMFFETLKQGKVPAGHYQAFKNALGDIRVRLPAPEFFARLGLSSSRVGALPHGSEGR